MDRQGRDDSASAVGEERRTSDTDRALYEDQQKYENGDTAEAAAAGLGEGDDRLADQQPGETGKRRKKDRKLQSIASRKAVASSTLNRTMAEWQETCHQLNIPSESEQFCDFVLVFDEIEADDIDAARNRTNCCTRCCHRSPKKLEECIQVGYIRYFPPHICDPTEESTSGPIKIKRHHFTFERY